MKAKVDENVCIGCGVCVDGCPQVFELKEGVAKVIAALVPKDAEGACREAARSCPVEAIVVE